MTIEGDGVIGGGDGPGPIFVPPEKKKGEDKPKTQVSSLATQTSQNSIRKEAS